MNKEIDTKTLSIIGGSFMIVLSLLLFFLVWNVTRPSDSGVIIPENQYQSIDIESEKAQAEDLVKGKNNFSGMPVSTLSTESGQDNPFSSQ